MCRVEGAAVALPGDFPIGDRSFLVGSCRRLYGAAAKAATDAYLIYPGRFRLKPARCLLELLALGRRLGDVEGRKRAGDQRCAVR